MDGNEPGLLDLVFTNEEGMIGNIIQNPGLGESDHIMYKLRFKLLCRNNRSHQSTKLLQRRLQRNQQKTEQCEMVIRVKYRLYNGLHQILHDTCFCYGRLHPRIQQ